MNDRGAPPQHELASQGPDDVCIVSAIPSPPLCTVIPSLNTMIREGVYVSAPVSATAVSAQRLFPFP